MNNCPKCGNPLQAGTTSCPICGTNISVATEQKQVTVDSVAQTSAPEAPVAETKPVEQTAVAAPVQEVAPVAEIPVVPETPAQPGPEATTVAAQPTVVATPEVTVQPTVAPVTPQQPVETVQAVASTPVAEPVTPAVEPTVATPATATQPETQTIASVATPATAPAQPAAPAVAATEPERPKKKKGILLPIVGVLGALVIGVAVYMNFFTGSTPKPANTNNQQKVANVSTTDVMSNGYKFKLPEGWNVRESEDSLIVVNDNESVYVKLNHSAVNIETISEDTIKDYLSTKENYKSIEVTSSKINAKDSYVVNTKYEGHDYNIQLYFLGGGEKLTLGVVVLYTSDESKTVNEPAVLEMIGTISYNSDYIKAIDVTDMYSDIFGAYNGIMNYQVSEPEDIIANPEPEIDNPENPENSEVPETPELPENPVIDE